MADQKLVKIKILIGLALAGSIFVYPNATFAYDTLNAHRAITSESTKIFNHYYPDKILSNNETNLLIKGSADEDTPPRWLNHFYDPVYNQGFRGLLSSKNWVENTTAQAAFLNQTPLAEYFSAPTDYSWERAIYDYVYGDKNRALEALGHTLHLIQDATVPDHTRDDAHPIWSTYENYAKRFELGTTNLGQDLITKKQQPISFSNLGEYFDYLANFSNNNFFSDDTILSIDYPGPRINKEQEIILSDKNPHIFGQNNLKENTKLVEIKRLKDKTTGKIYTAYTISDYYDLIPSDYWLNLSPKAVLAGAGVIKLFFDEVEKEKQTKRLFEKNKSLVDKFLDNLSDKVGNLLAGVSLVDSPSSNSSPTASSTATTTESSVATTTDNNNQTEIDRLYQEIQKLKTQLDQIIAGRADQAAQGLMANTAQVLAESRQTISSGGSGGGGSLAPIIAEITNPATSSETIIITSPTVLLPADFSKSFTTTSIIFSGTASSSLIIFNDFDKTQATTSELGEWTITLTDLPQGSSTIKFYARDNDGHVSLPTEINLNIDSLPLALNFSISNCTQSLAPDFCLLKPTSTLSFVWSPTKPGNYQYDLMTGYKYRGDWLWEKILTTNDSIATIDPNLPANSLFEEFKWQVITRSATSSEIIASSSEISAIFHPRPIVINEISWAGTVNSNLDEWLELKNYLNDYPLDLANYYLTDSNKTWRINLNGQISPEGYYLIERGSDAVISNHSADLVDNFIADANAKAFDVAGLGLKLWHRTGTDDELIDETPIWNKTGAEPSSLERTFESKISTNPSTWEDNFWCYQEDDSCALDRNATTTFGTPGRENKASAIYQM